MCYSFIFTNDEKSWGGGLRIERYSTKVERNLISEAEEEEGVLNSKLEWI